MTNLNALVVLVISVASVMIGSSSDLIAQVLEAQNKTEDNSTGGDSMNESGTISSLTLPIRPPFA